MFKEISNITRDSSCISAIYDTSVDTDSPILKLVEVKPDIFVDPNWREECLLITKMSEACKTAGNVEDVSKGRIIPEGSFTLEHYGTLIDRIYRIAAARLIRQTKKSGADYVIISADLFPVFAVNPDFRTVNTDWTTITCLYIAGYYKGIPVLISTVLGIGEMIWGVNEDNNYSIVTFVNDERQVCNKIVDSNLMTLIKLTD